MWAELSQPGQTGYGQQGQPVSAPLRRGARMSLRTKGIVAFVAVTMYVAVVGVMIAFQHVSLRTTVEAQRGLYAIEESLSRVNSAIAYAILSVNEVRSAPNPRASAESIALDIGAVQARLQEISERYPAVQSWILRLEHGSAMIKVEWGNQRLDDLRAGLHELVTQMDEITNQARNQRQALIEDFRRAYDSFTVTSLTMGLAGILIFGGFMAWFFSRLVWDIRKLKERAADVITGYRGVPIHITRHDELGALMESVNNMQLELRGRERQLEVARQQRFHHEKMAAIGSLAATIAHEVNNPIAAITGVAEAIDEAKNCCVVPPDSRCRPDLILEQTRRISEITRQLAEMTAPYSPEPHLLDFNALVRRTCSFIRYDKRFAKTGFEFDLDSQLPAVNAVADHLTQILMNLLINAADATTGVAGREPTITVQTGSTAAEAVLAVTDNGCGMDADVLARAFDEAFSTKPPGQGSGIGLFMCRSLIEAEGGRIELASAPQEGTRATVYLPRPAALE